MKKEVNYYAIGGQYDRYNHGGAATLAGAMRIASKNVENWDNWQGRHTPVIYRAEDCEMSENFFGAQMLPKENAQPVAYKEGGEWIKEGVKMTHTDIEKLENEFRAECEEIAEQCEAEGYPAHGSNYDLRVENLMNSDHYRPLFEE